MSALVRIDADRVVADSRDVASEFGKRHDHLLRAVNALLKSRTDLEPNFGVEVYPVATGAGGTRYARRFDMDRKGFMLLVMGFTGAKALALKVRWIDAFDEMERRLTERQAVALVKSDAANDEVPPAQMLDIREKLLFVREARVLGGRSAGRRAWAIAELPDVFDEGDAAPVLNVVLDESVLEWMQARIDASPGNMVQCRVLFDDYRHWCRSQRFAEGALASETKFGRDLQHCGYIKRRGQNWNYRIGLKIKD